MKNSLKQMMRTPVRTIFFFALMTLAAFLMTFGLCIWQKSSRTMAVYEDRFLTIGTVRQMPKSFEQTFRWDAEGKDYDIIKRPQYSSYITTEDLLFPGAEYIAGPEQRAYYGSYTPEYLKLWKSQNPNSIVVSSLVAEFSPLEDCLPDESVQIQITRVIGGDERLEGTVVWFCDHTNPEPEMLYRDRTYAAVLNHYLYVHGKAYDDIMKGNTMFEVHIPLEYVPGSPESGICLPDGSLPEDAFRDGPEIFEVTDGFYGTDAGKRLLNLARTEGDWQYIQPVTGTNSTCLLMPFYNGDAYISEGRDISKEEYDAGSKVCLAPRIFMENNGLSLGDKIKVRLLYTDTRRNAGSHFFLDGGASYYSGTVDTEGSPLTPFETSEYTVAGIYDITVGNTDSGFNLGADELIVPLHSIQAKDGRNLLDCGPMTDATSSFQIPNGAIDEFLKGWAKYGTDDLEFTFYDMGYSRLKAGMDNMKNMSLLLLTAGLLLTGLLLFFFSYLFITKQAERTAVERSLGMTRIQCRNSILSGFLLLVLLGSLAGGLAGAGISGRVLVENAGEFYYDTAFTVGNANIVNEITVEEVSGAGGSFVCCMLLIMAAGTWISWERMNRSLRREPMQLLSERQKE